MARPKNMLQLRLHEPATPVHVERAGRLHMAGERPALRDPLVIGLDESRVLASGARIVEIAHAQDLITADDLPALLSSIDRDGEKDE